MLIAPFLIKAAASAALKYAVREAYKEMRQPKPSSAKK